MCSRHVQTREALMNDPEAFDLHPLQEIMLAAGYPEPGADLGRADFELLYRAAKSEVMAPELFAGVLRKLREGRSLAYASRERFNWAMDCLFGHGFRDRALAEVSPDYLAFLEAARRVLAISGRDFAAMLARAPGGADLGHITGEAFGHCLFEMFIRRGNAVPLLPHRAYVDRGSMAYINAAVSALGLTYAEHMNVIVAYGGGCLRPRELDARGLHRVVSRYLAAGWEPAEPAPRISGRQGFITQAQVNLIWRLARETGLSSRELLEEWLAVEAGIEGGLEAVTAAGAGYVIDRLLPITITKRELREREARTRAAGQIADAQAMMAAE